MLKVNRIKENNDGDEEATCVLLKTLLLQKILICLVLYFIC